MAATAPDNVDTGDTNPPPTTPQPPPENDTVAPPADPPADTPAENPPPTTVAPTPSSTPAPTPTPSPTSTSTTTTTSTSTSSSSSSPPPTTSSSSSTSTSSSPTTTDPTSSSSSSSSSSTSQTQSTSTLFETITSTDTTLPTATDSNGSTIDPTTSSTAVANTGSTESGGLPNAGKIAIAVVVPITSVAILILVGLWFWRRHKAQRRDQEERRREVEDYAYHPNAGASPPNLGSGGMLGMDGSSSAAAAAAGGGASRFEMKEGSTGYRGWGQPGAGAAALAGTAAVAGNNTSGYGQYETSPVSNRISDTGHSIDPLIHENNNGHTDNPSVGAAAGGYPYSPEEPVGAMVGPSAANNQQRDGDIRRGPSNASSSYSMAARSDGSDEMPIGVAYSNYYDQFTTDAHNPYVDAQPIIRDNPARRDTRIETASHYHPQQSSAAGIAQNF